MFNFGATGSILKAFQPSSFGKALQKTCSEYCEVSYLHGVKYIYDTSASAYIRSLWAVTVLALLASANYMAFTIYEDFIGEPSRFIIESDHANTAELLYPSVTICPATVFNYSMAREYIVTLKMPDNITTGDVLHSLDQTHGFMKWSFKYSKQKLDVLQAVTKLNNITANDLIYGNRWLFEDFFFRCRFQSKPVNCSTIFRPIRTSVGFCATFNAHQTALPLTKLMSNRHAMRHGLSLILKDIEVDLEHTYATGQRFEILINEAHVYPDDFTFRKVLHKNEELLLRAQPTEITSSPEVWKRLTVAERKCAMATEVQLRFFPEYHKQNCLIECRSFIVNKVCGCVPFYLFRDAHTLVCDFDHIPCLADNYDLMERMHEDCNCVDSCEKVDFSVRLTRRTMDYSINVVDPFYDNIQPNYTVVHVYMQSQLYRRIRRDIVWNMIAVVANIANCFGVLTGLSILAMCQILYYFTFVLSRNYKSMVEIDGRVLFKRSKQ